MYLVLVSDLPSILEFKIPSIALIFCLLFKLYVDQLTYIELNMAPVVCFHGDWSVKSNRPC